MKYLVAAFFTLISLCLGLMFAWSMYNTLTDSWTWALVSLGVLLSFIVSLLVTTAAISAARSY